MNIEIIVVGGGIVGLSTAWQLLQKKPVLRLLLLEKETALGQHQTGHNSGVLHAGLYYRPGSAKARLAVQGLQQMVTFCRQHGVPFEQCGKIVVATSQDELPRLNALFQRGLENGLLGLQRLTREQINELEPHAAGIAAVHVPQEGIVDYGLVVAKLGELIQQAGGQIRCNARVERITHQTNGWVVETTAGEFHAKFVVTCAGLHADRLVRAAGRNPPIKIVPFRGEYYKVRHDRQYLVRNLIYPVPDPKFPFLGVHFTRLIKGGIEVGPDAVLAFAREGYSWQDVNLRDLGESLLFPGLWRFIAAHPGMCASEIWTSLSKVAFCKRLQKLVPEITPADLEPGGAGVRAQAMRSDGTLVEDFMFDEGHGFLHVLNAPSPAATAALAISERIAERVLAQLS